jgi:hypothetical protein
LNANNAQSTFEEEAWLELAAEWITLAEAFDLEHRTDGGKPP